MSAEGTQIIERLVAVEIRLNGMHESIAELKDNLKTQDHKINGLAWKVATMSGLIGSGFGSVVAVVAIKVWGG